MQSQYRALRTIVIHAVTRVQKQLYQQTGNIFLTNSDKSSFKLSQTRNTCYNYASLLTVCSSSQSCCSRENDHGTRHGSRESPLQGRVARPPQYQAARVSHAWPVASTTQTTAISADSITSISCTTIDLLYNESAVEQQKPVMEFALL